MVPGLISIFYANLGTFRHLVKVTFPDRVARDFSDQSHVSAKGRAEIDMCAMVLLLRILRLSLALRERIMIGR